MEVLTARSTTLASRVRGHFAAVLVIVAFALLQAAAKCLNREHPARTFLEGRIPQLRPTILSALDTRRAPKSATMLACGMSIAGVINVAWTLAAA